MRYDSKIPKEDFIEGFTKEQKKIIDFEVLKYLVEAKRRQEKDVYKND